jgi:hypothetical protein
MFSACECFQASHRPSGSSTFRADSQRSVPTTSVTPAVASVPAVRSLAAFCRACRSIAAGTARHAPATVSAPSGALPRLSTHPPMLLPRGLASAEPSGANQPRPRDGSIWTPSSSRQRANMTGPPPRLRTRRVTRMSSLISLPRSMSSCFAPHLPVPHNVPHTQDHRGPSRPALTIGNFPLPSATDLIRHG